MRQLKELEAVVAKGGNPQWAALAARFGRTERAVRTRADRLRVHRLRWRGWDEVGLECANCLATLSWSDTEQRDPVRLCEQAAAWAHAHARCKSPASQSSGPMAVGEAAKATRRA